jgi:hypothetical protein
MAVQQCHVITLRAAKPLPVSRKGSLGDVALIFSMCFDFHCSDIRDERNDFGEYQANAISSNTFCRILL